MNAQVVDIKLMKQDYEFLQALTNLFIETTQKKGA